MYLIIYTATVNRHVLVKFDTSQKNFRYKKVLEWHSLPRVKISDGSDFAIKSYGRSRTNFQIWGKFENMAYMLFWGHVKNLLWGNFGKIKENIFLHTYSRFEKFSKPGTGCSGHVMFHSCRFSQAMRYKSLDFAGFKGCNWAIHMYSCCIQSTYIQMYSSPRIWILYILCTTAHSASAVADLCACTPNLERTRASWTPLITRRVYIL